MAMKKSTQHRWHIFRRNGFNSFNRKISYSFIGIYLLYYLLNRYYKCCRMLKMVLTGCCRVLKNVERQVHEGMQTILVKICYFSCIIQKIFVPLQRFLRWTQFINPNIIPNYPAFTMLLISIKSAVKIKVLLWYYYVIIMIIVRFYTDSIKFIICPYANHYVTSA